jgi:hypothetical protein
LLILEVAVFAFLALGLAAGLSAAPVSPMPARVVGAAIVAVILGTLPLRALEAVSPDPPDIEGASEIVGEQDGVNYRRAEPESVWRVRAHSRFVLMTLRWDAGAGSECRLRVRIMGRDADETALTARAWQTLRYIVPPGGLARVPPVVQLSVSSPECRLLVGDVTGTR